MASIEVLFLGGMVAAEPHRSQGKFVEMRKDIQFFFNAYENGAISMLTSRLHRVHLELQSHRHWLNCFVTRTQLCREPSLQPGHRSLTQHHGLPRTIRLITRQHNPGNHTGTASFATKKLKVGKLQSSWTEPSPVLSDLRQAVQAYLIKDVARLYHALPDKRTLSERDFRTIAQCLHHCLRVERRESLFNKRREDTDTLVAFAEELVKDVKGGNLAPNGKAHVHLLSFFKESGVRDAGIRFWQWLEARDDLFVNVDVYGAAIELLAVNGASLSEMEDLYQQALNRFPANFAAYHLSPEAIVPDRDEMTRVGGIPMTLLQGILTARLLHGDTRNAYLALDTALRLYPDQTPPRFFILFLEERPLLETYTIFTMACRGGIMIPQNQFRKLLSMMRSSSDLSSPARHALALRAMLSSLYMYIGCGGQVSQNAANELVVALTQLLRLKGVSNLEAEKKQKLVEGVVDVVRTALGVLARYGARPGISAFNAIITNLGGYGHSKQQVGVALSDAKSLGLEPTDVTMRSILTAAGTLNDKDFVMKAWKDLKQARLDAGQYPNATDFHVLVKMCRLTDQIDLARGEFEGLKDQIPSHSHDGIELGLDDDGFYQSDEDSESADFPSLLGEMEKVRSDLEIIEERTKGHPKVQDFRDQLLPMTLLSLASKSPLAEVNTRKLYDELTTEQRPSQASVEIHDAGSEGEISPEMMESSLLAEPTNELSEEPAISSTNLSFGTLRYENWKSINHLLERAESSDRTYHKVVDEAIAAGVVPPQRGLGLNFQDVEKLESHGLSDLARATQESNLEQHFGAEDINQGREHILRLRGRLA